MTLKGRINQSVCRWCFEKIPFAELARQAAAMGLKGIDLVDPPDWPTLKQHGLVCTMTPTHTIEKGLNDPANHAECLAKIRNSIELTSAAGFPNVICFSGNCQPGLSDEAGLENSAKALREVVGLAEKKKITLCMELLNAKVNHPAYMCCRSEWGAELVRRVGSEQFKLLYDIYHMQVEEGDVIATIRKHHDVIGHYHTAGVPGRHEIDEQQELFYPAIMRAIADTGYKGYVAHEFLATRDPMESLRQAVKTCDV